MAKWTDQRFRPTYQPMLFIDTDRLIDRSLIPETCLSDGEEGFSLCIRRADGNSTRGGHYVNARSDSEGRILISSLTRIAQAGSRNPVETIVFRNDSITCQNLAVFCEFLNHYCGRKFSAHWYNELSAISTGNRPPGSEF